MTYVDLHSHLLPGLDDGAATMEETRRFARRLDAEGVRDVACTSHIKRAHFPGIDIHELAGRRSVLSASRTAAELQLSAPTVNAAFARLEDVGVLREVTGRRRGRLFVYEAYLELLQAER